MQILEHKLKQAKDLNAADKVVDDVLKMNLKHLARLTPDPDVRDAANRRLLTFRRRKTSAA